MKLSIGGHAFAEEALATTAAVKVDVVSERAPEHERAGRTGVPRRRPSPQDPPTRGG
jgi:hypothetical protein